MRQTITTFCLGIMLVSLAFAQDSTISDRRQRFYQLTQTLASATDTLSLNKTITDFYHFALQQNWIPYTFGDTVVFLYQSADKADHDVRIYGDMNQWSSGAPVIKLKKIGSSSIYMAVFSLPPDARVDYKIIVNQTQWILDPANPHQIWSGFGPNSELSMPDYQPSPWITRNAEIPKGSLSTPKSLFSDALQYKVQYQIYVPVYYRDEVDYPVLYVFDGNEYADPRLGHLTTVLDNLIHNQEIHPVVAVFIDPRNPDNTGENRRFSQYINNPSFVDFMVNELMPAIKSSVSITDDRLKTGLLGTSLGGLNSAYTGIRLNDKIGLVACQSPAFWAYAEIYNETLQTPLKDTRFYISAGTINDDLENADKLTKILISKGLPVLFQNPNESHSWGNWAAHLDDILIYFFK